MENLLKKQYTVLPSMCDAQGALGLRNVFDVFMDMAAAHAVSLGVGYYDLLELRCCWVAVRTRVRFYGRIPMGSAFLAETWPGKPGLAKCDRFYRLFAGERLLAEGRTEWAVQDLETGMVRRTDSFGYPLTLPYRPDRVCDGAFTRFRDADITSMEPVRIYTVDPMDIDAGHHMNNTAYIRMLLGTFSTAELNTMQVSEIEISYRRGCFEGETLSIYRRRENGVWSFEVKKPDGETAVHALMRTEQRQVS